MASLLLTLLQLPFYFLLEVIYFITRCRPKKQIRNEHVLITGASQGIGGGLADKFAEMGNTVHCVGRNKARLDDKVKELRAKGYKAHGYTCDISKLDEVEKLYRDITGGGFTVTVLVNNAGVAWGETIGDLSLEKLDVAVKTNLTSNMWLIKLFLPKMVELGKGHVINMSSGAGLFPFVKVTDYCATKAGQIHMTDQLRAEFIDTGVKFTTIFPANVATSMTERMSHRVTMMPIELCSDQCIRGILEEKEEILVMRYAVGKMFVRVFPWLPAPVKHYIRKKTVEFFE